MQSFIPNAFRWPADRNRVLALLNDYRAAGHVFCEPHLWRFLMLVSSRLWKPEREAQIWTDPAGRIAAFAMLNSREPNGANFGLEHMIQPDLTREPESQTVLQDMILSWATSHLQQTALNQQQELTLYISVPEITNQDLVSRLNSFGFTRYTQGHNVYMADHLTQSIAVSDHSDGFRIRALADAELDTYDALFGFTAVNRNFRFEQLASDEYQHFVAVVDDGSQDDGKLVGYSECSFSRTEWQRSGQRIGWLDYIGVQDLYSRQGLGHRLVAAALDHLMQQGAEDVRLITASSNSSAQQLYQKLGFVIVAKEYIYRSVY